MRNFAHSQMEVPIYQSSPTSWDHFVLSVISSSEVLGKSASIRSKLLTAACWSWKEKRGRCEANLLYVESDFSTTDKTFTVILWSSSQNLCLLSYIIRPSRYMSRRGKRKAWDHIILWKCDLIWPLMPHCVMAQVSVNSQIHVFKTSHFHFYW